jgi:hypothetical protein
MNAREFDRQVRNVCANSSVVARVSVLSESIDHTQLRIFLTDLSFVDVYHHQLSGKTSFAQILDDRRIFAADNKRGFWHWHPREDPLQHVSSDYEITFEEFMARLETDLK